jgi:DNA-binding transcriptional MerR regulator
MMTMTETGVALEIGAVGHQLGISPNTIRSWERRYHLIVPERGQQGQRLYDPQQILLLRRIAEQIRRGVSARAAHEVAAVPAPIRTARVTLKPNTQAPFLARRAVDDLLREHKDTRFAFSLRLVASELVSNAVTHGSNQKSIRMEMKLYRDAAELGVLNVGDRFSLKKLRSKHSQGGHGLDIVEALAESWAIETSPRTTTITARIPVLRPATTHRTPAAKAVCAAA